MKNMAILPKPVSLERTPDFFTLDANTVIAHDVVMAPTTYTYLDYYQSKHIKKEPLAIGGFLPLEQVYAFEPILNELSKTQARHILGAQAQLWTEENRKDVLLFKLILKNILNAYTKDP